MPTSLIFFLHNDPFELSRVGNTKNLNISNQLFYSYLDIMNLLLYSTTYQLIPLFLSALHFPSFSFINSLLHK